MGTLLSRHCCHRPFLRSPKPASVAGASAYGRLRSRTLDSYAPGMLTLPASVALPLVPNT